MKTNRVNEMTPLKGHQNDLLRLKETAQNFYSYIPQSAKYLNVFPLHMQFTWQSSRIIGYKCFVYCCVLANTSAPNVSKAIFCRLPLSISIEGGERGDHPPPLFFSSSVVFLLTLLPSSSFSHSF